MRTTLLKSIFTLAVAVTAFAGSAQTTILKEVIIANGGAFSLPDNLTIAAYDPATGSYQVFDSVITGSVQDLLIEDTIAYLAAQDSIIKYNLKTHTRIEGISFPAILSLTIIDDYLVAGKWYGATPFVVVYDKVTLDSLFQIDSINNAVGGAVIADSMYIPYNISSNSFTDSLGRMAVVDLNTRTVARIVELGTDGVGASSVFAYGNFIYIMAANGVLIEYSPADGSYDVLTPGLEDVGFSNWYHLDGPVVYGKNGNNIISYNVATHQIVDADVVGVPNPDSFAFSLAAVAYDTLNQHFYFTYSDYIASGYCLVIDTADNRIDSFQVAIAPDAIALYYGEAPTSVAEIAGSSIDLQVYPNPATQVLNISFETKGNVQINLKDLSGKTVITRNVSANGRQQQQLSLANLANGLYLLQVTNGSESYTTKVVKW